MQSADMRSWFRLSQQLNPARVEDLKQAARRFGELNAVPAGTTDVAVLNNTLLDGMPVTM